MSQHHYSGSFCSGQAGLLAELMNKGTIRSNLTYFLPDIAATHASDLDYIFGETNSYSCHGAPGVSNTAGAALWALDYGLFASQIGISRLHFHEGIGYKYNLVIFPEFGYRISGLISTCRFNRLRCLTRFWTAPLFHNQRSPTCSQRTTLRLSQPRL